MSDNIAHLDDVRDALDFSQKFFGVMSKEQVLLPQLVRPLNDLGARSNLAAFLKAGCPAFVAPDTVSAPKPVAKKPTLVFVKQTLLGTTPVTVYGLGKRLRIADMLRAFLTLAPDASLDEVEKLLKEHKHPIPDAQADEMLESQAKFFRKEEGGEDFGLRGDGWANLILVINSDDSVSVVYADWDDVRWDRYRYSLDFDVVWDVGRHLVLSNSSDTSSI